MTEKLLEIYFFTSMKYSFHLPIIMYFARSIECLYALLFTYDNYHKIICYILIHV